MDYFAAFIIAVVSLRLVQQGREQGRMVSFHDWVCKNSDLE